jgi:glycerol-3-phosphate dehydrogenase
MVEVDVVIFGGGVAGFWLLDLATERGWSTLLVESGALGAGQTVGAQGIIHGGLKYTLDGLLRPSATAIKDLPALWRASLEGQRRPDLSSTTIRSQFCHLWTSGSLKSQLGMIGARVGLEVKPVKVPANERPAALAECPGTVLRLDEQVIEPSTMLAAMAKPHARRLIAGRAELECATPGQVSRVHVAGLEIAPRNVVFTAGQGNAALREAAGLPAGMQRRPLHMAMLRGPLPELNGHCVDGAQTRVTITTTSDSEGRRVWQLGGQISEDGVKLERAALIAKAASELRAVIPGIDLASVEGSSYRVDRAEQQMPDGKRPPECFAERSGNVITGWPTKMVLAPQLAGQIVALLDPPSGGAAEIEAPRPSVAQPPWALESEWIAVR